MASFYNRDAFSDLMEQLRIQGTPMVEGGRGKSSVGMQGISPSAGDSSTAMTQAEAIEQFQKLDPATQQAGINAITDPAARAAAAQQLGITSGITSASQQAAMDALQSSPFTTGLTPDVVMANYNLRNAGIINRGTNVLPSSRPLYTTSTGGISTGVTPTSTGAATGANQITVTGQSGAGTTLGAGAITPVSSMGAGDIEQITTTVKRPEDEAIVSGVTPTIGALPTGDIAGEVFADLPTDREQDQSTFINTAVNALSTVTGLPLGDIYEIVTTAERPKEVLNAALGALGLSIPEIDFGTAGETFEVRPENLVPPYFDPAVGDFSGVNDTTTAGTGGPFDIANLAAIRSAVPGTYDPNRRAGSGGQRYFSDVQYAPQGGIAGAQAAANAQAMMLAYQNAMNPAYQVRPGATVDRATSMAQRAAGLASLMPSTVTGTIPAARTTTTGGTTGATTGNTADTTAQTTELGNEYARRIMQEPGEYNFAVTDDANYFRPEVTFGLFDQGLTPEQLMQEGGAFEYVAPGSAGEAGLRDAYSYYIQTKTAQSPVQMTAEEIMASYVDPTDGFSQKEIDTVANLLTTGQTNIGNVAETFNVSGMDVVEQLLRGGYETPAQMVERLTPMNEGLTEEKLIANLLETGRATPEEISSYYGIPVEAITTRYRELGGTKFAQGGDVNGFYLGGTTDGMADQIPATINNMQPAALSDGEFVIPADVVSHLGNGNSDAGAKELYSMMDRIRKDRTGTTKQGRQIDPNKYLA